MRNTLRWPRKKRWNQCFKRLGGDGKATDALLFYAFHRRSDRGYVALTSPEGRGHRVYLEAEGFLSCTCADYLFRRFNTFGQCKHGRAVAAAYGLEVAHV